MKTTTGIVKAFFEKFQFGSGGSVDPHAPYNGGYGQKHDTP